MTEGTKITVVVPTYNERDNLPTLVDSLAALDLPNLHLLVVDDHITHHRPLEKQCLEIRFLETYGEPVSNLCGSGSQQRGATRKSHRHRFGIHSAHRGTHQHGAPVHQGRHQKAERVAKTCSPRKKKDPNQPGQTEN